MDHTLLCTIFLTLFGLGCCAEVSNNLLITNVDRTIDVTSQIVKIASKISITNSGNSSADFFTHSVELSDVGLFSFIAAYSKSRQNKLEVSLSYDAKIDKSLWQIAFAKSLQPGGKVEVQLEVFLTNALTPFPKAISQKDKQLVVYDGNVYFYSPYTVVKQKTTILLGTNVVESFTQLKPFSHTGSKIVYGPFENTSPFSEKELSVHYENNSPFLSVTSLLRVLELSHWGNIAVEEQISLEHRGAALKGPFSRIDPQGPAAVKWFETVLPAAAQGVYYRDDIGNVSTSHLRVLSDAVHLKLQPRFPIFGGWKTAYTLGYNIPAYEALYNSGEDYILKIRLLDHVFDDMIVEDLITKVILPEGAYNILVKTPYPVDILPEQLHHSYLDTTGRTVMVLRGKNLVENHIADIEVSYSFPSVLMLHEPLLLTIGVYTLLISLVLVKRLDLTIRSN